MPSRPCQHPTCSAYVATGRYCAKHAAQGKSARLDRDRYYDQHVRDPIARKFYNSKRWLIARQTKLANYPVCERCNQAWAQHVHHIIPFKHCNYDQQCAASNLRALCQPCHNAEEAEAAR